MEDKQTLKFEGYETTQLIHQIIEVATWQARSAPVGSTAEDLKLKPEHIRDGANLVFLALDLIEEWKASH